MADSRNILVVQVAALGRNLLDDGSGPASRAGFAFRCLRPVFPALTCSVQAAIRTAAPPVSNGLWGNGFFDRATARTMFWEQSAALVRGDRLWSGARSRGATVGLMFWQQSLGEDADLILSPKPVHKHHGGVILDCYGRPPDLHDRFRRDLGPFPLMRYWGPLASAKSSRWIVEAVRRIVADASAAPALLLSYLPHLDYDLQRFGPGSPKAAHALNVTMDLLASLRAAAEGAGWDWVFYGDYAIAPVSRPPVFIHRAFREAGWTAFREVAGMEYPDFFASPVVAVPDHEVALLYVRDAARREAFRAWLAAWPGAAEILDVPPAAGGADGTRRPDFVVTAPEGSWYAYPWWTDRRRAPDFAAHVDIHNKPGYDPAELFFGFPPPRTSLDAGRVRGTHGRAGAGREAVWATSLAGVRADAVTSHLDLAAFVRDLMTERFP